MIMKHERNEDKNGFLLFLLPEIFTVIAGSTAVYAMGIFGKQLSVENALRNAVMTAMALAVAGFFLRREQLDSQLDYDNDEHLMRFWIAVWSCLLLSLACTFLPVGGWPFLPVFVVLSLFSNLPVGILFSSVFLMIASFEGQTQGIFFLYFISGIFAACLFQHLEQEFVCMEEHPQVRAYNNGFESLTVVELISMIIGTGTKRNVEQARQIYNVMGQSLRNIAKARPEGLQVVQGIGDNKAMALQAAMELAKRFHLEKMGERPDLSSSLAIYNFLHPIIGNLDHEQAHLLLMNQNFKLIKDVKISEGGLTETAVDIRMIIREATLNNATIIAFAHNHPSNCPTPSKADDFLTQQIAKACELMRLFFMDHVIIADGTYYSYHDKGKLDN